LNVGSLTDLPILPYMLNWFSRKPGIVLGSLSMLLGIGLQAGTANFGMFDNSMFYNLKCVHSWSAMDLSSCQKGSSSGLLVSYTTEIFPYNTIAKDFTVIEYALYGSLFSMK
jgi:hypothetical protein